LKKYVVILVAIVALSGCATVWKTMGVATEKTVIARNAELEKQLSEMKASVDDLAVKVGENKSAVADIRLIKDSLAALQGRTDALPAETIRKLAEVLVKAADELTAAADSKP
jgi:uncharacterized lipoprotein YajG